MRLEIWTNSLSLPILETEKKGFGSFKATFKSLSVAQHLLSGRELIYSSYITDWTSAKWVWKDGKEIEAPLTKH